MHTDINSEDRLVQKTFADYLRDTLGWESAFAWNDETFGPGGNLGRDSQRDAFLKRDLREALTRLNPNLPESARDEAFDKLTQVDFARSLMQHNHQFYKFIQQGVPVSWRDAAGETRYDHARVIDFRSAEANRLLAVREMWFQGQRVPHYRRRPDIVCFVNGLPLVLIELKAVYHNIRQGFDNNLTDYMTEQVIPHVFHHNAFLVVSNGDRAKYGSISSKWEHFAEWKRNEEKQKGDLDAKRLLDGMLAKERLLDLIENFILFDESKPGGTRKIVARNHQVLGVNKAVASVVRQEELKREFPPEKRLLEYRIPKEPPLLAAERSLEPGTFKIPEDDFTADKGREVELVPLVKRAHPDLGRLGVFWHTQGSGKSYSMAFFTQKVRRSVRGNFTFVIMTDREDLDNQIFRTFVGCGAADEQTPRAASGKTLKALLQENHRLIFSLVHKFNQEVSPDQPYSKRDDIIVISDEAHRTQSGKLARNMRLALPNAAFIGFTGTPLFKHDELTRRIFGTYVSRYDFKRSEDDKSTVKLIYENRGEKLGIARLDLNDRIAEKVAEADLDPDQMALLERLLGKDYEVITADDRLDKLADDFVEYCSTRWESGKSLFVCIDKVTCGRMYQRIVPRWQAKLDELRAQVSIAEAQVAATANSELGEKRIAELEKLRGRIAWMDSTIIEIIISEAQNEVRDFQKWGIDIVPHRTRIKFGFSLPGSQTLSIEDAFKAPEHPFRIAIVCAMWLTGFDVECLSTLYIDKPMKAHTLMQAIARANRVYPGKDCGVIVDYNGMLKSLRQALAQYATGDEEDDGPPGEIVAPIETLVLALVDGLETVEKHLLSLGFDAAKLRGARGFDKISLLGDAVNALYTSDEAKRRFEIMAREVFARFKALLMEPSVFTFAERHDNIEAIYKKLEERRETADVTDVLKELHRIVNEAIRAAAPGEDHAEGLTVDLSKIDFDRLRKEFAKVPRKNSALQDIRAMVEKKLARMLQLNPLMMDYYRRYQEIIADYNREKDRATVEQTFAALVALAEGLDQEQRRAVEEGLTNKELALFDLLRRENLSKADRERVKQASKSLLASLQQLLEPMGHWTRNAQTQAEVQASILDWLFEALPRPPFTETDTESLANQVYEYVWQQNEAGQAG
jgi:type I restriction enzyme R subunit